MAAHLPWYIEPTAACWECEGHIRDLNRHVTHTSDKFHMQPHFDDSRFPYWCQLMHGVLVFFMNHLGLSSLACLLQFVISSGLFPPPLTESNGNFDSTQVRLMQVLSASLGITSPKEFRISPPNHIVCILHWKIISKLLVLFDSDVQEDFRSVSFPVPLPCQLQLGLGDSISYIDSHCHMDKIFKHSGFKKLTDFQHCLSFGQPNLEACICNFVYPSLWSSLRNLMGVSRVFQCTIGVHPHFVQQGHEQELVARVADLLAGGGFVGVGEVGLDFTTDCRCRPPCNGKSLCSQRKIQAQRHFLHEVVPLAEQYHLPLILHCRDRGDGSAAEEVRSFLVETGHSDLFIHRHCFMGNMAEMHKWMESFPNVMFGLTKKSLKDPDTCAALSRLPMEKVLLETDSPYLGSANPWRIDLVAKTVSRIKNIPLAFLTASCSDNARTIYNL